MGFTQIRNPCKSVPIRANPCSINKASNKTYMNTDYDRIFTEKIILPKNKNLV